MDENLLSLEDLIILRAFPKEPTDSQNLLINQIFNKYKINSNEEMHSLIFRSLEAINGPTEYPKLKPPYTLERVLNTLTKDELTKIRQRLYLKGVSKLRKKELIEVLVEEIPNHVEYCLSYFDKKQFDYIYDIVKNSGVKKCKPSSFIRKHFGQFGILFTIVDEGKCYYVVPKELISKIEKLSKDKTFNEILKRNSEWIRITNGLLNYYGVLGFNQHMDFMFKYTMLRQSEYVIFLGVTDLASKFYDNFRIGENYYYNKGAIEPEKIYAEQKSKKNIDFYHFSYEELEQAGEAGYIDKNSAFRKFVRFFITYYDMEQEEAEGMVLNTSLLTQNGRKVEEILKYLERYIEVPNTEVAQSITSLIIELKKHTRMWMLKGHKPIELAEKKQELPNSFETNNGLRLAVDNTKDSTKTQQNFSRNKPCPCGSGKKYKRCCGK
ncbi:SEC-C domain-containing protein [Proteinivorax hydrogeniformans]|uniref:SEC-C domain-containing protein n=1 Tax=Proteinivorax hydrogeniformans TaxID=1826727 RepID=A0AAU8HUJ4_9FIRM